MAKFCTSSIGLSQQSHHARYWVYRDSIYDFPTLNSFFMFLYKMGCPQWAAVLLTHLMFSKRQNLAPVQLIYACRPTIHDIGFVETTIRVFRLWTVYALSLPSLCQQNFASVQLTYASRGIRHATGFVERIIMVFRPWTVSSYSYTERQS